MLLRLYLKSVRHKFKNHLNLIIRGYHSYLKIPITYSLFLITYYLLPIPYNITTLIPLNNKKKRQT